MTSILKNEPEHNRIRNSVAHMVRVGNALWNFCFSMCACGLVLYVGLTCKMHFSVWPVVKMFEATALPGLKKAWIPWGLGPCLSHLSWNSSAYHSFFHKVSPQKFLKINLQMNFQWPELPATLIRSCVDGLHWSFFSLLSFGEQMAA